MLLEMCKHLNMCAENPLTYFSLDITLVRPVDALVSSVGITKKVLREGGLPVPAVVMLGPLSIESCFQAPQ